MGWFFGKKNKSPSTVEKNQYFTDTSRLTKLNELYAWYKGDSTSLLDYYYKFNSAPSGVKKDYFWTRTFGEDNKKTHSGLPSMMIDVLTNVQGIPTVTCEEDQDRLDAIMKFNNFKHMIKQEETPLTLSVGGGAFKLTYDLEYSNLPFIEFYDDRNVDYEYKGKVLIAINYKKHMEFDGKDYTLVDRYTRDSIEYRLYDKNNKLVPLGTIPELEGYEDIKHNFGRILGVPVRFKADKDNPNLGRSVYDNKLDIFDDLDQSYSIIATNVRYSVPIEYQDPNTLDRDSKGRALPVQTFHRKIIKTFRNRQNDDSIMVTQPQIDFTGIQTAILEQFIQALAGIISPSSLGMETARDLNATAQREKEKVTFFTRDDMIDNQEQVIAEICEMSLMMADYLEGKSIGQYEVGVSFPEFASPSFEDIITTFYPVLANAGISEEMYVEKVYGNSLTEQEKQEEVVRLKEKNSNVSTEDLQDLYSDSFDSKYKTEDNGQVALNV